MSSAQDLRLFLDRSSNSKRLAQALRDMGTDVVTIGERYGVKPAETVKDVRWLSEASSEGRICVGADSSILKNELEIAAVLESSARYLLYPNNNLSARQQIERFQGLLPEMLPLIDRPGPWAYKMTPDGLLEVPEAVLRKRLEDRKRRRE
ncbi:hypothetical protein [Streptomyces aidingensis]|uniref:VapC45 PIN like domain-containing protein n=1 Tax=Streptomyces aidingensis TaxID=910347 RepID=A0A1I1TK51_9ACTN|nr:hypothetical protein [Streptomyces aidingensis]SFD59016.1 hypothetical protein SAMN05421773_12018 [Streptomyces aidingensis]